MLGLAKSWQYTCDFLPREMISHDELKKAAQQVMAIPQNVKTSTFCIESPLNTDEKWLDFGFMIGPQDLSYFFEKELWLELFQKHELSSFAIGFDPGSFKTTQANLFVYLNQKTLPLLTLFASLKTKALELIAQKMEQYQFSLEHFAFLKGRNENGLRLSLNTNVKVSGRTLYNFLVDLNILGLNKNLLDFLESIDPFFAKYSLTFDVSETIQPRIGINAMIAREDLFGKRKEKWDEIFNFLQTKNLVTAEKKKLIDLWQGCALVEGSYLFRRWLHHIKFIYDKEALFLCKGYLYTDIICEKPSKLHW